MINKQIIEKIKNDYFINGTSSRWFEQCDKCKDFKNIFTLVIEDKRMCELCYLANEINKLKEK